MPVGGGGGLSATKAVEVVSLLEPSIVIPMHYNIPGSTLKLGLVSKFLKEMGVSSVESLPSLKISAGSIPDETRVVLLNHEKS